MFLAAGPKEEQGLSPPEALARLAGVYDEESAESAEGRTDADSKEESDASKSDSFVWLTVARANWGHLCRTVVRHQRLPLGGSRRTS